MPAARRLGTEPARRGSPYLPEAKTGAEAQRLVRHTHQCRAGRERLVLARCLPGHSIKPNAAAPQHALQAQVPGSVPGEGRSSLSLHPG